MIIIIPHPHINSRIGSTKSVDAILAGKTIESSVIPQCEDLAAKVLQLGDTRVSLVAPQDLPQPRTVVLDLQGVQPHLVHYPQQPHLDSYAGLHQLTLPVLEGQQPDAHLFQSSLLDELPLDDQIFCFFPDDFETPDPLAGYHSLSDGLFVVVVGLGHELHEFCGVLVGLIQYFEVALIFGGVI